MKIKKINKNKIVLVVVAIIVIVVAIVCFSQSPLGFGVKYDIPYSKLSAIYIHSKDKKQIEKGIDKDAIVTKFILKKHFASLSDISEIYKFNETIYIDTIEKNNDEKLHVVWSYHNGEVKKYINDGEYLFVNKNNHDISKIKINFEEIQVQNDVLNIFDPFIESESGFREKYQHIGLQENLVLEELNQIATVTVYETTDQSKTIDIRCKKYMQGTDIVSIAMDNHTTVSNILKWLPGEIFNENCVLDEEAYLCVEKKFSFRYGRQVGILNHQTHQENMVINEWSQAEGLLLLVHPFLINQNYDCVSYEITQRPAAMDLCDNYFKEQAISNLEEEVMP